jgi:hypothetical protein
MDGGSAFPGWLPMVMAPRDHSFFIVRLGPGRWRRKHDEHVVRWAGGGWRSYTIRGLLLAEDHCEEWRPLDDAAREFLKQQRGRNRRPAWKRGAARGARIALG